jgi:hypothetical protein
MQVLSSRTGKLALAVGALAIVVFVLARAVGAQGPQARISMTSDWSHRHIVFSQPTTWITAWRLPGGTPLLAAGNSPQRPRSWSS